MNMHKIPTILFIIAAAAAATLATMVRAAPMPAYDDPTTTETTTYDTTQVFSEQLNTVSYATEMNLINSNGYGDSGQKTVFPSSMLLTEATTPENITQALDKETTTQPTIENPETSVRSEQLAITETASIAGKVIADEAATNAEAATEHTSLLPESTQAAVAGGSNTEEPVTWHLKDNAKTEENKAELRQEQVTDQSVGEMSYATTYDDTTIESSTAQNEAKLATTATYEYFIEKRRDEPERMSNEPADQPLTVPAYIAGIQNFSEKMKEQHELYPEATTTTTTTEAEVVTEARSAQLQNAAFISEKTKENASLLEQTTTGENEQYTTVTEVTVQPVSVEPKSTTYMPYSAELASILALKHALLLTEDPELFSEPFESQEQETTESPVREPITTYFNGNDEQFNSLENVEKISKPAPYDSESPVRYFAGNAETVTRLSNELNSDIQTKLTNTYDENSTKTAEFMAEQQMTTEYRDIDEDVDTTERKNEDTTPLVNFNYYAPTQANSGLDFNTNVWTGVQEPDNTTTANFTPPSNAESSPTTESKTTITTATNDILDAVNARKDHIEEAILDSTEEIKQNLRMLLKKLENVSITPIVAEIPQNKSESEAAAAALQEHGVSTLITTTMNELPVNASSEPTALEASISLISEPTSESTTTAKPTTTTEATTTEESTTTSEVPTTTELTTTTTTTEPSTPTEATMTTTTEAPTTTESTTTTTTEAATTTEAPTTTTTGAPTTTEAITTTTTEAPTTTESTTTTTTEAPSTTAESSTITTTEALTSTTESTTTTTTTEASTTMESTTIIQPTTTTEQTTTSTTTELPRTTTSTTTKGPTTIIEPVTSTSTSDWRAADATTASVAPTEAADEPIDIINIRQSQVGHTSANPITEVASAETTLEPIVIRTMLPTQVPLIAVAPVARALRTRPAHIERLYNEDGVEVLYGYSSVLTNNI